MNKQHFARKTIAEITVGVLVFVLLTALSGIIGNGVYAFIVWLWEHILLPAWEQITKSIATQRWLWVIILITSSTGLYGTFFWWNQSRIHKLALNTTINITELDASLLRLLVSLVSAKDLKNQMQRLLEELLREVILTLPGNIYRAGIYLPDRKKEYLEMRANYQLPFSSGLRRYYIGKDESRWLERGATGAAYLDGKIRIGHITWKDNQWSCDNKDFVNFDQNLPRPPYYSYIDIPIIGLAPNSTKDNVITTCLGVVTFDSHNKAVFDSSEIQTLLLMFGRRLASALSIYARLSYLQDK